MRKLLQFEFRKLRQQKSFYICCFLLIVFVLLSALLNKIILEHSADPIQAPTGADGITSALASGNITLTIGIFTALFVCEDFTDGIIKNIYAKGYSRNKVYFSKLIVVLFFSVIACVVCWLTGALAGSFLFESKILINGHLMITLLTQLLTILAYTCLFFAISTTFKKTGGAIAGCIVGPMLFSLVFNTVDSVLNFESLMLGKYWLDVFFGNLSKSNIPNETLLIALIMSSVYGIVFTSIGAIIHKRQTI